MNSGYIDIKNEFLSFSVTIALCSTDSGKKNAWKKDINGKAVTNYGYRLKFLIILRTGLLADV